ncbi:MAG: tRNA epoxyqueuosine(34) reductase QueG [Bacteroidales bacterium]
MAIKLNQSGCIDLAKEQIREYALSLGFTACGFAIAQPIPEHIFQEYQRWINAGNHGDMHYMQNYPEIRRDPRLLMEGAKSIITLALNYYPKEFQSEGLPQIAYYAYGADYHDVMRSKLKQLGAYINEHFGGAFRPCVDTAPIVERYWAVQSGLGFVGVNRLLIIPNQGSYYFLGELITDLELEADVACGDSCADCNLCISSCPVGALSREGGLDATKCLSAMTIEYKGDELPVEIAEKLGNRVYGCDRCQMVCPHNHDAEPTTIKEFTPSAELLQLNADRINSLTETEFRQIFSRSAIKRIKLAGLQRNLRAGKNTD